MTDKMSLLAVFAHPDDESCGPGATLAMYAHQRVKVALLCVTRGERGASGANRAIPLEEFGDIRERELGDACYALGISRLTVLRYPDGRGLPARHRSGATGHPPTGLEGQAAGDDHSLAGMLGGAP